MRRRRQEAGGREQERERDERGKDRKRAENVDGGVIIGALVCIW